MASKQVKLIEFPKMCDPGASLTVVDGENHLPFAIKRIYYLSEISAKMRGGHAHQHHEEVLIPIIGGFKVTLDDGKNRVDYELRKSSQGLYYPTMLWHELSDFEPGTIVLALASQPYDANDYYRSLDEFYAALGSCY